MLHSDAIFVKTVFKLTFEYFTYLVYFTLHLNYRHAKVRRHVCYYALDFSNHGILNLLFEGFKVKINQTVELDEILVIFQCEGNGSSYSYRYREVRQTRVCNIKIRNGEFYLIIALEIDKIDFSLKWTLSTKC